VRRANDAGAQRMALATYLLDDFFAADPRLPPPSDQATNIIRFIGERVEDSGVPVEILPASFHASIGSPNRASACGIVWQLKQRGLVEAMDFPDKDNPHDFHSLDLTLDGWEQYEAEKRGQVAGSYGFIALKFGDEVLDPFLQDVIKPAVATIGYELKDLRDTAQAGVIDNVMRERIRDAAFVLVDLTHANNGAYWEAGYAEGLGKPVLYLCERGVFDRKGTHFDTNHCTTVTWDIAEPAAFTADLVATLRRSLGLFATV
jgi:hypothetical protein